MKSLRNRFGTLVAVTALVSSVPRVALGVFADLSVDHVDCPAFTSAMADRAQFYLSAVLNSGVFRQCLDDHLTRYRNCSDPAGTSPATVRKSTFQGNNLRVSCDFAYPGAASAYAYVGSATGQATAQMELVDDWSPTYVPPQPYRAPRQPWNYRAADLVHEFLHAQGYDHTESWCPALAGYSGGINGAPYIVGDCVNNVIDMSNCGAPDSCPDPEDVRLPTTWVSAWGVPSQDPTQCECVPSLRHRASFRTNDGTHYLSAADNGGSILDATRTAYGAWETFFIIDLNGGRLAEGDYIQIRTGNGQLWRASGGRLLADAQASASYVGASNSADPATFRITVLSSPSVPAGTPIANNQRIALRAFDGKYVIAAAGGGGAVSVNGTRDQPNAGFNLLLPRRARLVRLRTTNGDPTRRYVTFPATVGRALAARESVPTDDGAFWIVDHDGGALLNGDTISLESDKTPGLFVSTSVNGTGTVYGDAVAMDRFSKFVIEHAYSSSSAPTPIVAGITVVFRSAQNTYLYAVPSSYPSQLTVQNYGSRTGNSITFTLESVGSWTVR